MGSQMGGGVHCNGYYIASLSAYSAFCEVIYLGIVHKFASRWCSTPWNCDYPFLLCKRMFRLVPSIYPRQLEVGHCFSMCNISTEKKTFPGHWSWPWRSMTLITNEQTGNYSINVHVRVHFLCYGWRIYSAGVLKHTYPFSHSTKTKTKQYYNNNKIMITNQNKK